MYDPTVAGRLEPRLSYVASENRATRPCSQVTIPSVIRKLERCPRHDEALSTSDIEMFSRRAQKYATDKPQL